MDKKNVTMDGCKKRKTDKTVETERLQPKKGKATCNTTSGSTLEGLVQATF